MSGFALVFNGQNYALSGGKRTKLKNQDRTPFDIVKWYLKGAIQQVRRSNFAQFWPYIIATRCLMVSTDQADPSCFYSRISWILMERRWFYFFRPLHIVQGNRSNNIKQVITTLLFKLGKSKGPFFNHWIKSNYCTK